MKSSASSLATLINTQLPLSNRKGEIERFYTGLFNSLSTSLLGAGEPVVLSSLSELPSALATYGERLSDALSEDFPDPGRIFSIRALESILKKLELPLFGSAASDATLCDWLDSEAACKEFNETAKPVLQGRPFQNAELQKLVVEMRQEIRTLLGDEPPDLHYVIGHSRLGPGASATASREFRHPLYQFNSLSAWKGMEVEVQWVLRNTMVAQTEQCSYYGVVKPPFDWRDTYTRVTWVESERYEDVPKSISKNRSIGIGPNLSTFVAQAYDHNLRQRLLNWGLDLTDQIPNQALACEGSVTGEFATLDLSCATDRVSTGLVYALLPPMWFKVLYPLRARSCEMKDGEIIKLEKFSSMGNALTFSLITLILAALIRSILRNRGLSGAKWRVYGDDVIVPTSISQEVSNCIDLLGLKVNQTKSFATGSFRESCGADFVSGVNVRPLYIKKPVIFVTDLYKYYNLSMVVEATCPLGIGAYGSLREFLLRYIPNALRVYGEPSALTEHYLWGVPGCGKPRLVAYQKEVSKGLNETQALQMRLYSGVPAESYLVEVNDERVATSRLYPQGRVRLPGELGPRILRRPPMRDAWAHLVWQTPKSVKEAFRVSER